MSLCPDCGYPNDPNDHRCEKCGIRFEDRYREFTAIGNLVAEPAAAPVAVPPVWHGEVTRRVARFRERHGLQPSLPLEMPERKPRGKVIPFPAPSSEKGRAGILRASKAGETPALPGPEKQQSLDFTPRRPASLAVAPLLDFPVAPLFVRVKSSAMDAGIVTIGYGLYFAAYYLAGGSLPWHRLTLVSCATAAVLLPMFYLFLFLTLTTGTPGMTWSGLRLVDFDGHPASLERRLVRVLASILSAASFLLGFLWAAVD